MRKTITFPQITMIYTNAGGSNEASVKLDEPTECPICKHYIKPILLHMHSYREEEKGRLSITYLCPQCQKPFLAFHWVPSTNYINMEFIAPVHFEARAFNKEIQEISPMFVKIYNQALAAESYQLDEIVGVGYRKALEFLIKDIAIHEHPEDKEKIEGMHLSHCIEQYIDYTRLKTVAKGAAWLGNDQTHYKQKFSDKDISSLIDYLDACIAWVDVVLKTESADNFLGGTS